MAMQISGADAKARLPTLCAAPTLANKMGELI
jgi:hypothetical protein